MADLDDFFAKKDKKKSKGKKFVTADEIAKRLEDTSKKTEVKIRKKEPAVEGEEQNTHQNEDEWKEFEEERKDYTGLKIGTMSINDEDYDESAEGNAEGQNESEGNAEGGGNEKRPSGPWKKMEGGAVEAPAAAAAKPAQVQEIVSAPKPTYSVYVSPAFRNQVAAPVRPKKKGTAPDLHSEEYFPSLGADKPADSTKNKHRDPTFEEVKHGSRVKASDLPHAAPLSIENRFTSLDNDAS